MMLMIFPIEKLHPAFAIDLTKLILRHYTIIVVTEQAIVENKIPSPYFTNI